MPDSNIYDLLKDSRELTSLPQVLVEVLRITDDDNSGASEIAAIVMKDPALTARLLRIVNSPFYSPARQITTINQSVMTVGTRAVKAMALTAGLYRFFDSEDGALDRTRFWRHSLEVAIACREIARLCDYRPDEEAFIAGLLHDIGILVLETNFRNQFRQVWKLVETGESLVTLEEKHWSTNHAKVGKFLMDQWGIPKLIGEAVAAHHNIFDNNSERDQTRLARIVALGNLISKFRICPSPPLATEAMELLSILTESLGLGQTVMTELQEKILGNLIKESEYLDIEIGSAIDLLREANNHIYRQYLMVESVLRENRKMQVEIAREQVKKAALESLKTITATLSHYINNASATILGRAQLVELAVKKGTVTDNSNQVAGDSMKVIIKAVEMISMVLEELKELSSFDIAPYHDEASILDIEARLKEKALLLEAEQEKLIETS